MGCYLALGFFIWEGVAWSFGSPGISQLLVLGLQRVGFSFRGTEDLELVFLEGLRGQGSKR